MMTRKRFAGLAFAGFAFAGTALTACGDADALASDDVREVTVSMSEFAFESSDSVFTAGVPYRFVLVNGGHLPHEWAVVPRGDADESRLIFEVEEEDLPAGGTVVREFVFPEAGEYDFSCYVDGHYEGGMVLPVRVRPADV